MPDTSTAFRLPRPLQPASHHALGLHNAPIFEYDIKEYTGDEGRPLIVVEPRRMDGRPQGPFSWFGKRVVEAIGETYGSGAVLVVHETARSGEETWLMTRDVPVPVFDEKDEATIAQLRQIEAQAQAAGVRPEQAVHQAVMAGAIKPAGLEMRKALVQILPEAVAKVMTQLFAQYAEPPADVEQRGGLPDPIGFAAMALAQDARDAQRRPRVPRVSVPGHARHAAKKAGHQAPDGGGLAA